MSLLGESSHDGGDLDVVDLESVVSTLDELKSRPSRPRDLAAENRALVSLVEAMTAAPDDILKELAETALDLCRAGSAGVSILTPDRKNLRWGAVAGDWAGYLGGGTPRDFGPCGTVLDRNAALLFHNPERHFKYLSHVWPFISEGLLIPFYVGGEALGTIWVVAHSPDRRFDAEDLRVMKSLAHFAAAAYAARTRQVAVRVDISSALASDACLREKLQGCAEAIVRHLDAVLARVWVANKRLGLLELQASAGTDARIDGAQVRVPIGSSAIGLIAEQLKPHLSNDITRDSLLPKSIRPEGATSFAGYPLVSRGEAVGVLAMFAKKPISHATAETLSTMSDLIAQGIQRAQAEEALGILRMELAQASRAMSLGALAASIAHEVNQPLSGIVTNASTCLRMLAADPPNIEGAQETARRTIRDGSRASDVVTRLRELFAKKDTTIESVDLNDAIREVMALSLSELQRNDVILKAELADDLPLVSGDRIQLQEVVLNLVRNAADAMSGVDDCQRLLVVRTEKDQPDGVRVSVQDTGIGIDPEGVDRLFQPFYTTKSDGMGIGLSVSRSIIESHHGRLSVVPNDGRGATFSFSIGSATAPMSGDASVAISRSLGVADAEQVASP